MPTNHKEKKNKIMTEIDEFRIYFYEFMNLESKVYGVGSKAEFRVDIFLELY